MAGCSRSMDLAFTHPGPIWVLPCDLSLTSLSFGLLFWKMELLSVVAETNTGRCSAQIVGV